VEPGALANGILAIQENERVNIDWTQAFIAGIMGGVIAAVFAAAKLLYQSLSPRFGRFAAVLLSATAIATFSSAIAYSPLGTTAAEYVANKRAGSRIARVMSEQMMPLLESPAFQQRIEGLNQSEVNALAFKLSSDGLLRLSDDQLIARAHLLNEAISLADEETCAAQLLGPTPEQAQQLLANLPDESLREWSKLSADASAASLRDAQRISPDPSQAQEAFRRILASLPEGDAERLANALGDPTALDPGDACWTSRTIFQSFAKLPNENQALVARVLAMQ
jgi:hypothetical protein